jgi:hypothetical protein
LAARFSLSDFVGCFLTFACSFAFSCDMSLYILILQVFKYRKIK